MTISSSTACDTVVYLRERESSCALVSNSNRRLDNLTADELSKNRLDSHWPLGVDHSELLFDGWLQAGIL